MQVGDRVRFMRYDPGTENFDHHPYASLTHFLEEYGYEATIIEMPSTGSILVRFDNCECDVYTEQYYVETVL